MGKISLLLFIFALSSSAFAAQYAVVTAERALVYSDQQMSSPLGYIARGKRVRVGEIPRNQAQIYPVIISGKVAYIRVIDVSTEKSGVDSNELTAERFNKSAVIEDQRYYSFSYLQFSSQIALANSAGALANNDSVNWSGISLQGGSRVSKRFDLNLSFNFLQAKNGNEGFTVLEAGAGPGLRIISTKRLILKWGAEALLIPFANYNLGSLFRINGYGYTVGTGLNLNYKWGENFGLFGLVGIYHTKILGLDLPNQFQDISPGFTGNRIALGASYHY